MDNISYEIIKHCGIISTDKNGWKKELNLVSWNNRNPKLDVRDWSPGREKMGKGITLTAEEGSALAALLVKTNNPAM